MTQSQQRRERCDVGAGVAAGDLARRRLRLRASDVRFLPSRGAFAGREGKNGGEFLGASVGSFNLTGQPTVTVDTIRVSLLSAQFQISRVEVLPKDSGIKNYGSKVADATLPNQLPNGGLPAASRSPRGSVD